MNYRHMTSEHYRAEEEYQVVTKKKILQDRSIVDTNRQSMYSSISLRQIEADSYKVHGFIDNCIF